jgi:hypothetical protein
MCGFSKKQVRLHRTTTFAIFALYLFVATSVDLFHTEEHMLGDHHSGTANTISSNTPCPACTFLAGHHSTGVSYALALLHAERLFVSQFLPHLAVVHCDEWACSIIPRAPPSTNIS